MIRARGSRRNGGGCKGENIVGGLVHEQILRVDTPEWCLAAWRVFPPINWSPRDPNVGDAIRVLLVFVVLFGAALCF